MPLHLLGKKSWNVYNKQNIERVRADEAAAAARTEENDSRLDKYDAAVRFAKLRGSSPPPRPELQKTPPRSTNPDEWKDFNSGRSDGFRKRRKLAGEDDTARDIRMAQEDLSAAQTAQRSEHTVRADGRELERVDIIGSDGHIQLFQPPDSRRQLEDRNADFEQQRKSKVAEEQEQGAMRFADAAGYRKDASKGPWYAKKNYSGTEELEDHVAAKAIEDVTDGKDAFGNPDSGRVKRDAARLSSADPLSIMNAAFAVMEKNERVQEPATRKSRSEEASMRDSKQDHSNYNHHRDRDHARHHRRHGEPTPHRDRSPSRHGKGESRSFRRSSTSAKLSSEQEDGKRRSGYRDATPHRGHIHHPTTREERHGHESDKRHWRRHESHGRDGEGEGRASANRKRRHDL